MMHSHDHFQSNPHLFLRQFSISHPTSGTLIEPSLRLSPTSIQILSADHLFQVMEDQKLLIRFPLTVIIIIHFLFSKGIKSEVYTVGGDEQWNTGANFESWAQQYNYTIGDVLVFKYTKGQHNVYEVDKTTYRSCDASSGFRAKYETGNDRITLAEAKTYWFICNVAGHCLGGMRFRVDVKQKVSNSTNSTEPAAAAAPTPPPEILEPSNSFVRSAFQRWVNIGIYIVTCVILLLI